MCPYSNYILWPCDSYIRTSLRPSDHMSIGHVVPPMGCFLNEALVFIKVVIHPKGPCTHIAYTLGPMYLYREYFKANVYAI